MRLPFGPERAPGAPGAPGAPPGTDPYDFSADPILQRIRAFGVQRLADAQAAAIRARAVAESEYGDVRARLGREQVERPRALTESLNKGNLFYSSEFGKQQTGLARQLAEDAASEQRRHQERLSGIDTDVLGIEREVQGENMTAEEAAAERLRERLGDLPVAPARPGLGARPGGPGASAGQVTPRPGLTLGRPQRPRPRFQIRRPGRYA